MRCSRAAARLLERLVDRGAFYGAWCCLVGFAGMVPVALAMGAAGVNRSVFLLLAAWGAAVLVLLSAPQSWRERFWAGALPAAGEYEGVRGMVVMLLHAGGLVGLAAGTVCALLGIWLLLLVVWG